MASNSQVQANACIEKDFIHLNPKADDFKRAIDSNYNKRCHNNLSNKFLIVEEEKNKIKAHPNEGLERSCIEFNSDQRRT